MPTFTYKGLSAPEKKQRLERYMASIAPLRPRAAPDPYRVDKFDEEEEKEVKRAAMKEWRADREKAYKTELEQADAKMVFRKALRHSAATKPRITEEIVFEKGKPVTLDDNHWLTEKLTGMATSGKFPKSPQWDMGKLEAVAPKATTTKTATKAEE